MTDARADRRASWLSALRVVAISDRRLMVPAEILAGAWAAVAEAFGAAVARAVSGCAPGSVVVQLREKDLDGGQLLQLVRAAQPFAPVIVNDRVDVALAAGAAGVHLPERGLAIRDARALAPSLIVGVSRHHDTIAGSGAADSGVAGSGAAGSDAADSGSAGSGAAGSDTAGSGAAGSGAAGSGAAGSDAADSDSADASGSADDPALPDLIQLGPIWPTPAKPTVPGLGEAALAWRHGTAALVAVGGIDTPARASAAAAAGAAAVAVIRAAWSGASLAPFVAAVQAGRSRRSL